MNRERSRRAGLLRGLSLFCIGWLAEETVRRSSPSPWTWVGAGRTWTSSARRAGLRCGQGSSVDARDEFAEDFCLRPTGERAVPGPVPVRQRALPAADRPAPGRGRQGARRQRRLVRLHRQGQRPGALRGRGRRARPRLKVHRAGSRLRLDPGEGDRLRRGEQPADRGEQEVAVLDRPERLGPGGGDRVPKTLERPDRGPVRLHGRPGRPARADEVAIPSRPGCRPLSTARRCRCWRRSSC